MYELDKLMAEIDATSSINLNGITYAVKNCVAAASEDVLKMSMYIVNAAGRIIKISVESIDLFKR